MALPGLDSFGFSLKKQQQFFGFYFGVVNEKCCLPYQQTKDATAIRRTAPTTALPTPMVSLRELRMETNRPPAATPPATADPQPCPLRGLRMAESRILALES